MDWGITKLSRKRSTSLAIGLTSFVLLIGSTYYFVWRPSVDQILAKAYADRRTVPLRIPRASYGPLSKRPNFEQSRSELPFSVLDAETRIRKGLTSRDRDPALLRARAEVDLLDWHYESALGTLQQVLTLEPNSNEAQVDLSIAYFERGESIARPLDFGAAVESLSRVLSAEPGNREAIFNRAILEERIFAFRAAIRDWKAYLVLDSTSPWADEARYRLLKLNERIARHDRFESRTLLTPTAFSMAMKAHDRGTWIPADARIEDYLDVATREWLPTAFAYETSSGSAERAKTSQTALALLGEILERNHGDTWLLQMSYQPRSRLWSQALRLLSDAIGRNRKGDIGGAQEAARRAALLFRKVNSKAGWSRAEAELVYALHRTSHARECLSVAQRALREVKTENYIWIKSFLLSEQTIAFDLTGDLNRTLQSVSDATLLAQKHHYNNLLLRDLGFQASLRMEEGDAIGAWKRDLDGLDAYWSGDAPPLRAYQFYADMAPYAEDSARWNLAYILRREGSEVDVPNGDLARAFAVHLATAKDAVMAGMPREARNELQVADSVLHELPASGATEVFKLYAAVAEAKTEGLRRTPAAGLARISRYESTVQKLGSYPLMRDYFNTLAGLNTQLGQLDAAKKAYSSAIEKSENELRTLHDERDRVSWQKETEASYKGLLGLLVRDGRMDDGLDLWNRYREYISRDPSPSDWRQLRQQLRAETVVRYAVLQNELVIWAYDNRGIQARIVPVPAIELAQATQKLFAECSDPDSNLTVLKQQSELLYKWLISPVEAFLDEKRVLIIEPDDALRAVPFAALTRNGGEYMGKRYVVLSIPSLAYIPHLRSARPVSPDSRVLIAEPSSWKANITPLPAIPAASSEVRSVAARFRRTSILRGRLADSDRIRAQLATAEVFHFVGHAHASVDRVNLFVASSNDRESGEFDAVDLRQTPVSNLQLVVLSACSTARVDDQESPDLDGLVRAFLDKGVPRVVATRWDVDSATMKDLMDGFYSRMLKGESAAMALRDSAGDISKSPARAHPFYWAGVAEFGMEGTE